ncbi:hypothetical protein OHB24_35595 [Kribbella sp. NBC_00482]|uniref:hypothetical protein n=1 Tax=Kribbella sp. NBC_00482 TaxID=2975968 RepID=UPI002E1831B6
MSSDFDDGRDWPAGHDAGGFEFGSGEDREYWWGRLGEPVKQRLAEFSGPVIDWWAYAYDGPEARPYVVVFGERGLVTSTPTTDASGDASRRFDTWAFAPGSIRDVIITHQATHPGSSRESGATRPGPLHEELDPQLRGFLGNLPVEAQSRLLGPFLTRDSVLSSSFHYFGTDADLDAWCYLAGRKSVTFARGRRQVDLVQQLPAWHLTCWQAGVRQ